MKTAIGDVRPVAVAGFLRRCSWIRSVAKLPKSPGVSVEQDWVLAFADCRWARFENFRGKAVERRAVLALAGDIDKRAEFVGVYRLGGRRAASAFVTALGRLPKLPPSAPIERQKKRASVLDDKLAKAREELARRRARTYWSSFRGSPRSRGSSRLSGRRSSR